MANIEIDTSLWTSLAGYIKVDYHIDFNIESNKRKLSKYYGGLSLNVSAFNQGSLYYMGE